MKSSLKFLFSLFLAAGSLTAFAASYTDGIEYFKAGQPDRAKILLERTLDDAGTNKAESYYYLGEIAFGNKDYTTAAEYYKKGLTEDPLYAYNIVGQGKLALTGSDKEAAEKEAEKYFKEALKGKNKKDAGINLAIAKAYYETGTPGYEEYMKKSYKADKKYPDYFMFEGDVLVDQQKYGDACGRYENAIYFDPNCIEAYVKYSHIYFDINPTLAIQKLEELQEIAPNSAIAQREMAEAYYKNSQYTKAAAAYEKYMQNPNHFQTDRPRYAALLYYDKQYEKSLSLSEDLLQAFPDNLMLKRLVMYNTYELKDYVSAVRAAEALFATPDVEFNSRDYMQYGKLLFALGEKEKSIAALEKAVEIDPARLELYKELMTTLQKSGKYMRRAEVQDLYLKQLVALEQDKTQDYFIAGRYYYMAATRAYQAKDTIGTTIAATKADSCFAIVVEKAPEDYRGHLWRASSTALLDLERKTGVAIPFYEKAIEVILKDLNNTETPPTEAVAARLKEDLIEAYTYMANFEYVAEYDKYLAMTDEQRNTFKFTNTIEWCNKILSVDPNHAATKEFLNIISQ